MTAQTRTRQPVTPRKASKPTPALNVKTSRTLTVKAPSLTVRDMPTHLGVCTWCGATPALITPNAPTFAECPKCRIFRLLTDAATSDLEALIHPVISAWAQQYEGTGLSRTDVADLLDAYVEEHLSDSGDLVRWLTDLQVQHPTPTYQDVPTARLILDVTQLRRIERVGAAVPDRGIPRPYFLDTNGEVVSISCGLDTITLMQPNGDALIVFTGIHGGSNTAHQQESIYVPAHLLTQVQAELTHRDGAQS